MTDRPYDVITFDCYGTLIDWNGGIASAFQSEVAGMGVDLPRASVLSAYHEIEPKLQTEDYRPYREVLAEGAVAVWNELGLGSKPTDGQFLAESIGGWLPFEDTNRSLSALKQRGFRLGILSNVDDLIVRKTTEHFEVEFDFIVTAEQVQSYKPKPAHFEVARGMVGEGKWLHVAQSWFHDVVPATRFGIPVVWVNRLGEDRGDGGSPIVEVADLSKLVSWLER